MDVFCLNVIVEIEDDFVWEDIEIFDVSVTFGIVVTSDVDTCTGEVSET